MRGETAGDHSADSMRWMVGTWGLEPQTSTVSIYTSITYNPLVLLLFRFQKPEKQP